MVIKLRRLVAERPSLADVPIAFVRGRAVTARELLSMVEAGDSEAVAVAERLGLDPTEEEVKQLAIEFWRRSLPPNFKVYVMGVERAFTVDDIVREIEAGTPIGKYFIKQYEKLVKELVG